MPWMHKLYETYLANEHLAGDTSQEHLLAPYAHIIANSHISVRIDLDGNFIGAEFVEKNEPRIIIPVTEESITRSNKPVAHPLCDKLSYVAGDLEEYVLKFDSEKNKLYIQELSNWANSDFGNPKVKAILNYINKKALMSDLIMRKTLIPFENNKFEKNVHNPNKGKLELKKLTINNVEFDNFLVRFSVVGEEVENVWEDKKLFENYINYFSSLPHKDKDEDICYITGKKSLICRKHANGIVLYNNTAKIISANSKKNDKEDFVYRGRIKNSEQATALSFDVSHKVHSVLSWLVAKQGVREGNREFVCWNPRGIDIYDPYYEDDDDESTAIAWKTKLKDALKGYRGALDDNDDIVIISLEPISEKGGRIAITYYNELKGSDYYDRIQYWGEHLHWYFRKGGNKFSDYTPSLKKIVYCTYGTEKEGKKGKFTFDVSEKLMGEQYQRLFHCMLDRKPIPKDILHRLFMNACNPQKYKIPKGYSYSQNFEDVLSITCALKNFIDYNGKDDIMILDKNNTNRSYLFGRLLAIADEIENKAYKTEYAKYGKESTRITNAMRLWSAYSNHPFATFKALNDKLIPYLSKLTPVTRNKYNDMITEIFGTILSTGKELNRPLDENFILGYYLQRAEFINKNKDSKEEEENDITE